MVAKIAHKDELHNPLRIYPQIPLAKGIPALETSIAIFRHNSRLRLHGGFSESTYLGDLMGSVRAQHNAEIIVQENRDILTHPGIDSN